MRMVVAAVAAGSDYCDNFPGKSFGTSREAAAKVQGESKADVLLEKVCNHFINRMTCSN